MKINAEVLTNKKRMTEVHFGNKLPHIFPAVGDFRTFPMKRNGNKVGEQD